MSKKKINYWVFQSNPKIFLLKEALEAEVLRTFSLKAHKAKIKPGDKVILWEAGKRTGCYGLATIQASPEKMEVQAIEKPYFKKLPNKGLRASLQIDYNLWNRPITKEILPDIAGFEPFYAGIPGTNFKATKAQYEALIDVIEQFDAVEEPATAYLPTRKAYKYLNLILQGPPGTGKTYQTVNYALSIIESRPLKELILESRQQLRTRFEEYQAKGQIHFITFHQSYSYEDFVEGIKPISENGQLIYGIEDGLFKRICLAAQSNMQATQEVVKTKQDAALPISQEQIINNCEKYVLIIDEINRGNIAGIFGELISLLEVDKRAGQTEAITTTLPYSKKNFTVPSNLHIIGTMNTSDKHTTPLDLALRRRFEFVYMPPLPHLLTQAIDAGIKLPQLLLALNARIEVLLDRDYLIGHAYFISVQTLEDIVNLFSTKIIPLLAAYFFQDWQKVIWVIGQQFFVDIPPIDARVVTQFDMPFLEEVNLHKRFQLKPTEDWTEKDFIRIYDKHYE